jgi:hypothetical protein
MCKDVKRQRRRKLTGTKKSEIGNTARDKVMLNEWKIVCRISDALERRGEFADPPQR